MHSLAKSRQLRRLVSDPPCLLQTRSCPPGKTPSWEETCSFPNAASRTLKEKSCIYCSPHEADKLAIHKGWPISLSCILCSILVHLPLPEYLPLTYPRIQDETRLDTFFFRFLSCSTFRGLPNSSSSTGSSVFSFSQLPFCK